MGKPDHFDFSINLTPHPIPKSWCEIDTKVKVIWFPHLVPNFILGCEPPPMDFQNYSPSISYYDFRGVAALPEIARSQFPEKANTWPFLSGASFLHSETGSEDTWLGT